MYCIHICSVPGVYNGFPLRDCIGRYSVLVLFFLVSAKLYLYFMCTVLIVKLYSPYMKAELIASVPVSSVVA